MDGQDIFAPKIEFNYQEIAGYLARLIPTKIWKKKSEKLNLYERFMSAAPAVVIQK